jgi:hypothetical protein
MYQEIFPYTYTSIYMSLLQGNITCSSDQAVTLNRDKVQT